MAGCCSGYGTRTNLPYDFLALLFGRKQITLFNKGIFNPIKNAAFIVEFIDEYNAANKPPTTEMR